jgi:hypothetical protein
MRVKIQDELETYQTKLSPLNTSMRFIEKTNTFEGNMKRMSVQP